MYCFPCITNIFPHKPYLNILLLGGAFRELYSGVTAPVLYSDFPEVRGLESALFFFFSCYKSHWDESLHDQNVVYIPSYYFFGTEFREWEFLGGSAAANIFPVWVCVAMFLEDELHLV